VRPNTSAASPVAEVATAGRSIGLRSRSDSGSRRGARITTAQAIGGLTSSPHRQLAVDVSTPPTTSPTAAPVPKTAEKIASARLRAGPGANVSISSAIVLGLATAAPAPWTTRQITSHPPDGANPPASEAAANTTTPITKARLRPNASPIRPPSRSNPPNAIT